MTSRVPLYKTSNTYIMPGKNLALRLIFFGVFVYKECIHTETRGPSHNRYKNKNKKSKKIGSKKWPKMKRECEIKTSMDEVCNRECHK